MWRDPQTISPEELASSIQRLESAVEANPHSSDLRTCLGMAYAMNFDVYKSLDALTIATELNPESFWAQMKYSEWHYRLRALPKAEAETLKALELATNGGDAFVARKQLQEIRRLIREGTQKPAWTKPLLPPLLVCLLLFAVLSVTTLWK